MSDAVIEALSPLVSGDGLILERKRFDPMSGVLLLRLSEGDAPCTACRMSAALLKEIAMPLARKADPRVRRIDIIDDRPPERRLP